MNRGETVPLIKELNLPGMKYLELDVNFSLGFMPGADEQIVSVFLSRTQPSINGILHTLESVDFLLHLCTHLYKEASVMSWVEMGRDILLYKYCDIYLYLNKYMNAKYADDLIRKIEEVGLNKESYYTLYYTKELFAINNPLLDKVLGKIRPDKLDFMHQIIDPQTKKIYSFNMKYSDWVFCSNRRELLNET